MAKYLGNQFSEIPKNQERFNYIFNTALAARGLDAGPGASTSTSSLEGYGGGGLGGGGCESYLTFSLIYFNRFSHTPLVAPQRQFFQVLGATKQWGETGYYLLQKEEQNAQLVQVHKFFPQLSI